MALYLLVRKCDIHFHYFISAETLGKLFLDIHPHLHSGRTFHYWFGNLVHVFLYNQEWMIPLIYWENTSYHNCVPLTLTPISARYENGGDGGGSGGGSRNNGNGGHYVMMVVVMMMTMMMMIMNMMMMMILVMVLVLEDCVGGEMTTTMIICPSLLTNCVRYNHHPEMLYTTKSKRSKMWYIRKDIWHISYAIIDCASVIRSLHWSYIRQADPYN